MFHAQGISSSADSRETEMSGGFLGARCEDGWQPSIILLYKSLFCYMNHQCSHLRFFIISLLPSVCWFRAQMLTLVDSFSIFLSRPTSPVYTQPLPPSALFLFVCFYYWGSIDVGVFNAFIAAIVVFFIISIHESNPEIIFTLRLQCHSCTRTHTNTHPLQYIYICPPTPPRFWFSNRH